MSVDDQIEKSRAREDARDRSTRQADLDGEDRREFRVTAPLGLGILTFLAHEDGDPRRALTEGLTLFETAESLGYEFGLVRVRHFQPYLSGPIAFLSAAAQRTSTLRLGTAVLPFHAEDPVRLAEEVLTLDLLSGGRLELGVSATDYERGVRSRWAGEQLTKDQVWERIDEFLGHLDARPLDTYGQVQLPGVPEGAPVTVTPVNTDLRQRIWYGPGSLASVRKTARRGLKLQVSSLNTEDVGLRFEPAQYDQIAEYRRLLAEHHRHRVPEVNVSRNIFPVGGPDEAAIREVGDFFTNRLYSDGLHRELTSFEARYSHPAYGSVDHIIEFLRTDVALAASNNLIVLVPSQLSLDAAIRLITTVAKDIAPALR